MSCSWRSSSKIGGPMSSCRWSDVLREILRKFRRDGDPICMRPYAPLGPLAESPSPNFEVHSPHTRGGRVEPATQAGRGSRPGRSNFSKIKHIGRSSLGARRWIASPRAVAGRRSDVRRSDVPRHRETRKIERFKRKSRKCAIRSSEATRCEVWSAGTSATG